MGRFVVNKKSLLFIFCSFALALGCGKTSGSAPSELSGEELNSNPPDIPTDGTSYFALAYGSSTSDRTNLQNRIAGYQAPGLSEVFSQWRRFSGSTLFNSPADISSTPSYCFSGFDVNFNWNPSVKPPSTNITPGTYSDCVNSDHFNAASWNYIASPDRIYNAANGTNFGGFISTLKFTQFTLEAELTSTNTDDDTIGLIIAAYVDGSNNIHTHFLPYELKAETSLHLVGELSTKPITQSLVFSAKKALVE